jgi:hypothetical protein
MAKERDDEQPVALADATGPMRGAAKCQVPQEPRAVGERLHPGMALGTGEQAVEAAVCEG